MKTLKTIGSNYLGAWNHRRTACRGIVVREGSILLSYEANRDQYGIPGGGQEGDESLENCCAREIAEETGILTAVGEAYLIMEEYYGDWLYETRFFICTPIGKTPRKLTPREEEVGLVPKWVPLEQALSIFSKHQEYAPTDEEKRGIYLREFTALQEYAANVKEP